MTVPDVAAPLDPLLPRPEALPRAVRPEDVGAVGWQILLRDRVLAPVWGDVAVPAARPAGPALRADALRSLVPPRAVLGRAGAVWVHTDGPVPARFDVLVEQRVRRPSPHPLRVPHECPLPPDDVVRLGDVRVTTVQRTGLDLARWLPAAEAARLLERLVRHAGLDPDALVRVARRSSDRRLVSRLRDALAAQTCAAGTPAPLDPVMR